MTRSKQTRATHIYCKWQLLPPSLSCPFQIQLTHTQDGKKALIPLMHDLRANNTFAARHAHQTPALSNIDIILKKASQECTRPSQLYTQSLHPSFFCVSAIVAFISTQQVDSLCIVFVHTLCFKYLCITKKCQNGLIPLSSSSYRSSRILHLPSCESSPQSLPKPRLAWWSSVKELLPL